MPYFTGGDPIGPNQSAVLLDDFPSSVGASLQASMGQQWAGNVSTLLFDDAKLHHLNDGEPMPRVDAQAAVQAAGVKLDIPESGYTRGALDYLIQRRQDDARRADILARAPGGILPATARFGVQLAAGIADPLNVAASFIPFVGEARIASLLARGGESALARTGARALIGAGEGAVGQIPIEALSYPLHQQLQDDYTMADALTNLAFGAAMGGALHVVGGAAVDALRGGPHPYERFQGLAAGEIQDVFNFERERAGMTPEDQARALASYTPATRRAIGVGDVEEPPVVSPEEQLAGEPAPRAPMTARETVAALSPDLHEVAARTAIADAVQGRIVDVDSVVGLQPKADSAVSFGDRLDAALRERGITVQAGDRSMAGGVPGARVITLADMPEADFMAKHGNSVEDVKAHEFAHTFWAGATGLPNFRDPRNAALRTELRAASREFRPHVWEVAKAHANKPDELLADGMAFWIKNPERRGEFPAIDALMRSYDSGGLLRNFPDVRSTLDDVRAQAQRQATPERISVADFFAARAEGARLAREQALREATPDAALAAAGEQRSAADEALEAVLRNLEQAGQQIEGLRAQLAEQLAPFDEAVADAKNVGNAVRAAALCGIRT